jgi:hypothetical protein
MQTITYTVHLPIVNERVRISGIPTDFIVDSRENPNPPYDRVLIKSLTDNSLSRMVIINGYWQVEGYNKSHEITFHGFVGLSPTPIPIPYTTAIPPGITINNIPSSEAMQFMTPTLAQLANVPNTNTNIVINDPYQIKVGDVGTYTTGGRVGREYWDGFVVTEIIKPGKSIRVTFDRPILVGKEELIATPVYPDRPVPVTHHIPEENKYRILQYRKPGRWMFKGVSARNMSGRITMGTKRTGAEEGIF